MRPDEPRRSDADLIRGSLDEPEAFRYVFDRHVAVACVAALGTAREWPVLLAMDAEGDYPEVVWEYAGAVAGDGRIVAGKSLGVAESYRDALCP